MKTKHTLTKVLAGLATAGLFQCALAQGVTIDFSSSRGSGAATDKVLVENIRVATPVVNPFSPGTFTTQEVNYNVVFKFDPTTLHLVPETIAQSSGAGASTCASAAIQIFNSVRGAASPLVGANVTVGTQTATTNSSGVATLSGLPEGLASIGVSAAGYVTATQAATLACGGAVNNVAVALSPASGQAGGLTSGQFRVILTWGQNPSDLDSHMTGPNADGSRWHVYYSARTSGSICGLDVDDTSSYGPETITCPATNTTTGLRAGIYRYSVHHYSGSGNISNSGASVRLEFANGTVYNYTPPAGFSASNDVWTVFELTVGANGTVSVAPVNTITRSTSASAVRRATNGAIQYGSPEDANLFKGLSK